MASLITSLSLLARVSLRSTALFVELILETARFSTVAGLGITRRALIAAVGSARTMHAMLDTEGGSEWDPQQAGLSSHKLGNSNEQQAGYLSVLDKYTAVGIYLIHHTFTLAELFAMSGFYLVDTSIQAGLSAASESVSLIDGIMGSNETSRALSAFISLVKRELDAAHAVTGGKGGRLQGIKAIAALTKAITAFAVCQNATYKRTARTHSTKVLYDCTLLGSVQNNSSWRKMIVGGGNFVKQSAGEEAHGEKGLPPLPAPALARSPSDIRAVPTTIRPALSHHGSLRPTPSRYGSDALFMSDLGSEPAYDVDYASDRLARRQSASSSVFPIEPSERDEEAIVAELNYLVGSDGEAEEDDLEEEEEIAETPVRRRPGSSIQRAYTEPHLPPSSSSPHAGIQRLNTDPGTVETVYEETLETETIETIETTTISGRNGERRSRLPGALDKIIPARRSSKTIDGRPSLERDGWTEVDVDEEMLVDHGLAKEQGSALVPRGTGQVDGQAEDGKISMQVVLKTITRKVVQRTKVTKRLRAEEPDSNPLSELEEGSNEGQSSSSHSPQKHSAKASTDLSPGRKRGAAALKALFTKDPNQHSSKTSSSAGNNTNAASAQAKTHHGAPEKKLPKLPNQTSAARSRPPPSPTKDKHSATRHPRRGSIASMRSFTSTRKEARTTVNATDETDKFAHGQFPQAHFVQNLHTFMRYSMAAYGQNFMRIFGSASNAQYLFTDTTQHHSNVWNFAHHVGIAVENVKLSSFTQGQSPFHSQQMAPLVNYITVDHKARAVVLSIRGSLGLSDILTDLTCDSEPIPVRAGDLAASYLVHSGMLASAVRLQERNGTVFQTLKQSLEENPTFGVVLTGHSLGAGVAALLAVLWSIPTKHYDGERPRSAHLADTPFVTASDCGLPPGRPIHAYGYGVPAVASPDLSRHCRGLVTSLVHAHDFIPTLSLGMIRDMRNVAETLSHERETAMAQEIVKTVVGLHQRKRKAAGDKLGMSPSSGAAQINYPRPTEPPTQERELEVDGRDLERGRTTNLALKAGYTDPVLKEEDEGQLLGLHGDERDTNDWLWSLIKTMRASMYEEKLYPPGDVFCIEAWNTFVTHRTAESTASRTSRRPTEAEEEEQEQEGVATGEAHRVLLRHCPDVEKRFSEPIFARSMLRDHLPTNCERGGDDACFCLCILLTHGLSPRSQMSYAHSCSPRASSARASGDAPVHASFHTNISHISNNTPKYLIIAILAIVISGTRTVQSFVVLRGLAFAFTILSHTDVAESGDCGWLRSALQDSAQAARAALDADSYPLGQF